MDPTAIKIAEAAAAQSAELEAAATDLRRPDALTLPLLIIWWISRSGTIRCHICPVLWTCRSQVLDSCATTDQGWRCNGPRSETSSTSLLPRRGHRFHPRGPV